jgi:LPPG:FO 2-phospho-L-lactate transferase
VGDDDFIYGAHVAADLDTVAYTLAGIEGPQGWGIAGDTTHVLDEMADRGLDTSFRLGDRDLATCLYRTERLRTGWPLSTITAELADSLGIDNRILPATDDAVRTTVQLADGSRISFQDYFVKRRHRDTVAALEYDGAAASRPAPGVVAAIDRADLVVIAPSNPPLSIWPILAVPDIRPAVERASRVVAVSPLFGGRALKGPAAEVMASLGLPPGTPGVLAAYQGLLTTLVVDSEDAADEALSTERTRILAADTRIADRAAGAAFATWLLDTMVS